jgi:hypothetical protein
MSNISSTDTLAVKLMRWVARFLSIPWAFWALFWTFFVVANYQGDGYFGLAVTIIIMVIALLMFIGAAIIAGVWGKEAFGGGVLLVDGALIIVCFLAAPHIEPSIVEFLTPSELPFNFVMVLPPLVAGSLFLACHRISKTSGEHSRTGDIGPS